VCWLRFETRTSRIQVTIVVTFTLTCSVRPSVNFCPLGPTFPVEVSPQNVRHFPAIGELEVNALQDTASECENVPFITRSISLAFAWCRRMTFARSRRSRHTAARRGKWGVGVPSATQPHSLVSDSCDGATSCIGAQIRMSS
jgi:hypothetical protein